MRKFYTLLVCLSLGVYTFTFAQGTTKSKDMLEIGLHGGTMFVSGDLSLTPGYGAGIHIRKSLDYVFSLRLDGLYGVIDGSKTAIGGVPWEAQTTWIGSTLYGVMSLNSLKWDRPTRKSNFFFMLGAGANYFSTDFTNGTVNGRGDLIQMEVAAEVAPHLGLGIGASYRISPRINIGLEAQANVIFGNRADKIDGFRVETDGVSRSLYRDIPGFAGISINYNLGNPANASEPIYWVNPLDNVMNEIQEIKNRPAVSLEDSDGDGVIDAIDQENNTPADAIVDVKGRTLDSDRDGVPDHLDREPFYTPRANETVNSEGIAIDPSTGQPSSRAPGVSEDRVNELIQEALKNYAPLSNEGRSTAAEWFLPMIHFASDSYRVKYSDYGNLASIARTLKANQGMRLVVIGFTDATGGETTNNNLSYQRANAVIEHLETQHGIARSKMVLQWKGSDDNLVPATSSYMNRRVEFRAAGPGDFEMEPPASSGDGY
jgi:outer membrane protein OmpA-like peptidoglycan-associated protein